MQQKTHDEIAKELWSQLKTLGSFLPVETLSSFDSSTGLRDIQRLAARTFASQLWLCANPDEIRKLVNENSAGAEVFYMLAAFVVDVFTSSRDLTKVKFSGWGHYSLLSDAVTIYLKEVGANGSRS